MNIETGDGNSNTFKSSEVWLKALDSYEVVNIDMSADLMIEVT